jgi:predicted Zn-ribbon and HTH transcriptional regulator
MENIIILINQLEEKVRNYKDISNKTAALNKSEQSSEKLRQTMADNEHMDETLNLINNCLEKLHEYANIKTAVSKLEKQEGRKDKGNAVLAQIQSDLNNSVEKYKDAIKSAGKCPICFSEVDDKALDNFTKNLF